MLKNIVSSTLLSLPRLHMLLFFQSHDLLNKDDFLFGTPFKFSCIFSIFLTVLFLFLGDDSCNWRMT